jgi:hypothetical protein
MTVQEHAFRAYYASMTDAELLKTAANRKSFIGIAQKLLAEELTRRNLQAPEQETVPLAKKHAG